jgi:cell volume regulation protein A
MENREQMFRSWMWTECFTGVKMGTPMMIFSSIELFLMVTSALLFLSVVASKVSDRLGVPALVLFLTIGMLAGSEGIGRIHFNDPWLAKYLGVVALIFIIFSGGIDTKLSDVRSVMVPGILLSSLGVFLTALFVACAAVTILDLSFLEAFLLGAIVSSTDAAAVFSVLRSKKVSLKGKVRPLLELESGSNDPMAVLLTIGVIRLMTESNFHLWDLIPVLILEVTVGVVMGFVMGKAMIQVINRVQLSYEGLYSALTISMVVLIYGLTAVLKGNGFLAVYIAAVILGNGKFLHKGPTIRFHEGLAWLMQIVMFLALGLLVFPSRLLSIAAPGLIISLVLMLFARPLSVMACLLFTKFRGPEKHMIAWVGLRGAVPIILATFPLIAHVPKAEMIFNIVFFIVLTSVLLQGTSIPLVAKLLKVDAPPAQQKISPLSLDYADGIDANLEELIVPYTSKVVGMKIFEVGLPEDCLVVLICRDDKFFIPKGTTQLQAGDVLMVLGKEADVKQAQKAIALS